MGRAQEQLHREERAARKFSVIVDSQAVGMMQGRERTELSLEPLACRAGERALHQLERRRRGRRGYRGRDRRRPCPPRPACHRSGTARDAGGGGPRPARAARIRCRGPTSKRRRARLTASAKTLCLQSAGWWWSWLVSSVLAREERLIVNKRRPRGPLRPGSCSGRSRLRD